MRRNNEDIALLRRLMMAPSPLDPSGSSAASSGAVRHENDETKGKKQRESSNSPSRLFRAMHSFFRPKSSRMDNSTSESTPLPPAANGAVSQGPPADANTSSKTTLITGGTTIYSARSVVVNVSSPNVRSESPLAETPPPPCIPPSPLLPFYPDDSGYEIYRRHMMLRKKGWHPLWIPQANLQLPIDYRKRGNQVGDVGIIAEDGAFDFLFNICTPAFGSVNPPKLPHGFQPISPPFIPEQEVTIRAEHSARDALTSKGISKQTLSSDFVFTCSLPDGAVLVLPDGAVSERLANPLRFQQYFAQNAKSWYAYAREMRGPDVSNGDLHLVFACEKATEWGMAAFNNPHRVGDSAELRFRDKGEEWRKITGTPYDWEYTGGAEGRIGPRDNENRDLGGSREQPLRNQTLFIRTISITLQTSEWDRLTDANGLGTDVGFGSERHQQSAVNAPNQPGPSTSTRCSSQDSSRYPVTHSGRTTPDTQYSLFPELPRQPSQVLNEYLLCQFPDAKLAATSSSVWSQLEDDDLVNTDTLISAVLVSHTPEVDSYGVASFVRNDPIDAAAGQAENVVVDDIQLSEYVFGEDHGPRDSEKFASIFSSVSRMQRDEDVDVNLPDLYNVPPAILDDVVKGVRPVDSVNEDKELISSLAYPKSTPDLLRCGGAFLRKFNRLNDMDDLDNAIHCYAQVKSLSASDHHHHLEALVGLSSGFTKRFRRKNLREDLEELHATLKALSTLDAELVINRVRDPETSKMANNGNVSHTDLAEPCLLIYEAARNELAIFNKMGDPQNLRNSYNLFNDAAKTFPRDHPNARDVFASLAATRWMLEEHDGQAMNYKDVMEIIDAATISYSLWDEGAVDITFADLCGNLGGYYRRLFALRGGLDLGTLSIQFQEKNIALMRQIFACRDEERMKLALVGLAATRRLVCVQTQDVGLLTLASQELKDALQLGSTDNFLHALCLRERGMVLELRTEIDPSERGRDSAIEYYREALEIIGMGYPRERADLLLTLAWALIERGFVGDSDDAEEAHSLACALVEDKEDDLWDICQRLGDLLAGIGI